DAIILDLEDAVAAAAKDAARANLSTVFTELPIIVRVNASSTPWHEADLAAARAAGAAAVMLPKAENVAEVLAVVAALPGMPVVALIETARGVAAARAIAAVPGIHRLAFGSIDYCADLGCAHEREILLPARLELVSASRIAGIAAPLDGVTTALGDLAMTAADAVHARALGMSGKLCIHPKQIPEVLRSFFPTDSELVWASKVVNSGDGAVTVDGSMVDEPIRIRARAILAANGNFQSGRD
ncbi:CoA ester lyase, partial [Aquamicrobium sp.]|uniref:HpcH/HpaI aldolase/citrate lyase family protein n=1 Tax=Aquamicrobium sp. TaxID=1872579 RepID=UPI00258DC26B